MDTLPPASQQQQQQQQQQPTFHSQIATAPQPALPSPDGKGYLHLGVYAEGTLNWDLPDAPAAATPRKLVPEAKGLQHEDTAMPQLKSR